MPSDWKEIPNGIMVFYLPQESEAADPLSEKIVVTVSFKDEESARMPLTEMVERGMNENKALFSEFTYFIIDNNTRLDGNEAIKFTYQATIQGKKIEYVQISAKKDNIVYGIMHSCIQGNCKYTDIYNDMVNSFKTRDYISGRTQPNQ